MANFDTFPLAVPQPQLELANNLTVATVVLQSQTDNGMCVKARASLKIMGLCSKKNMKQLNRVSISCRVSIRLVPLSDFVL